MRYSGDGRMTVSLKEIGEAKQILDEWLLHKTGNHMEEALMFDTLMKRFKYDQKKIRDITGLSQAYVSKRYSLLKLIPELQALVKEGKLKPTTAYQLSRLPESEQKKFLMADKILLQDVEDANRKFRVSKEVMDVLTEELPLTVGASSVTDEVHDPVVVPSREELKSSDQIIIDALQILSTSDVKLDVGWTDEGEKFWRFLFNGKPLVSVFQDGLVLVDLSSKMEKTRRSYHFTLNLNERKEEVEEKVGEEKGGEI